MPITEFMSGFRTDPETRRLMGLAFELTRVTLRLSDRKDPLIQLVADRIIELAKTGERNPERLCDLALASIRPPPRVPRVDNKRPPGCWRTRQAYAGRNRTAGSW